MTAGIRPALGGDLRGGGPAEVALDDDRLGHELPWPLVLVTAAALVGQGEGGRTETVDQHAQDRVRVAVRGLDRQDAAIRQHFLPLCERDAYRVGDRRSGRDGD